jgi:hypothetical protein
MVCCLVLRRLVCLVVSLSRLGLFSVPFCFSRWVIYVPNLSCLLDLVVLLIFLVSCILSLVSFSTSTLLYRICSSADVIAR